MAQYWYCPSTLTPAKHTDACKCHRVYRSHTGNVRIGLGTIFFECFSFFNQGWCNTHSPCWRVNASHTHASTRRGCDTPREWWYVTSHDDLTFMSFKGCIMAYIMIPFYVGSITQGCDPNRMFRGYCHYGNSQRM